MNHFMKRNAIIIIILILFSGCSMQKKLSSQLYQVQKQECGDYQYLRTLKKNRNEANIFNSFNLKNDTLYIIESYDNDLERGVIRYVGTYWSNKENYYSYDKIDNRKIIMINHEMFNKYIMSLVNSWDIEKIKSESKQYVVMNPFKVYATRIIFIDSNPQIETICFDYIVNMRAEEEFYK